MKSPLEHDALLLKVKELCKHDRVCKKACSSFIHAKTLDSESAASLLSIVSGLLLNEEQTMVVARHMSDMLPILLSVALEDESEEILEQSTSNRKLIHEKRCIAVGKLLRSHPDTIKFALKYFNDNPAPFYQWNTSTSFEGPTTKKRRLVFPEIHDSVSEEELVWSCLEFLNAMPDHFKQLWDWSIFINLYLNHKKTYVRWLASQCVGILCGMSCIEKKTLIEVHISSEEAEEFSVKYEAKMPERNCSMLNGMEENKCVVEMNSQISRSVVSVAGIILPVVSVLSLERRMRFVSVSSTVQNLQSVALGVATGRALCLQGPVGCGKTALVEHLASLTGRSAPMSFMKVQIGDQTDSKMLLGTYQCTEIPGEFVWQPGVLTQAVIGGHWLLLEDIDSCTTDVAAVLSSLLESNTLSVPGYRDCVCAAPGFQLFFTQRLVSGPSGLHRQRTGPSSMLQKLWLQVEVEPLSRSELVEVVQTLYPALSTVATRMVDVFLLFSAGGHHSALEGTDERSSQLKELLGQGARLISTRDLIKWCTRSVESFDVSSPESALKVFQNAIDIFCCSISNTDIRLKLAESVAATLGIIHTKAEYYCNMHKPTITTSPSHFVAGRVSLPRRLIETVVIAGPTWSTFSFTRPAASLLERIACCVDRNEPVLLVGETGVGKTSCIQYLAQQMRHTLSVINMNQQSDSADLLGGYKPVELKYVVAPIRDEFETLFRRFFSVEDNAKFLNHIAVCFSSKRWKTLVSLMKHSTTAALKRFKSNAKSKQSTKKMDDYSSLHKEAWLLLSTKLQKLEMQLKNSQSALAFAFVEGSLVKALKEGHWVLLDEINLATAETLECLSGLLEGSYGSISLLERGDSHAIQRHPHFRIFAAMNPATDVGKKELPPGIRNRFTEFFVDELVDKQDLLLLCGSYLSQLSLPASRLDSLVRFYMEARQEAVNSLTDGTGHKPHYSLRTLCRALKVASSNPCGSVPRSLFEGFLLSFLTQLDYSSHPVVESMIAKAVLGKTDSKSLTKQPIPEPTVQGQKFVQLEGYWVTQGPLEPHVPEKYILTSTVRRNLHDLVRVVSLARLPVLLQGETSVGKTSLITYLAHVSGNRCLRINNHEHTDLQEYIGCYAADEQGNLAFREGVLVEAMRFGYWIILDELNLAPSDVLEALNRVLDDNRELFILETQQTVKAHPNFMLFATQNPPGLYGGRKVLSRAFRNRFVELHLDEIPPKELETIMHLRCDMPPSYCKKMVAVMCDLQMRRKGSAAFAGKQGYVTLRDLFRWGERYRLAKENPGHGKFYDWDQHIADEGYLILAGRVRKEEERITIQDAISKQIKRSVDPQKLFTLNSETSPVTRAILEKTVLHTPPGFEHIVWTFNMRRLAVLLGKACEFLEPVLLVGETGCGKTTLCQLLAASRHQALATINCHMHTESADFLGGLRPVREHHDEKKGKLFEWVDGPLIEAMCSGGVFLSDEISLADDSVLERLNSLLEPERKLLLAEKGAGVGGEPCEVTAKEGFIFIGTMNPGGDYGKKELSPALRNRFTEIWCEGCTQRDDLVAVIEHNLQSGLAFGDQQNGGSGIGTALVDFLEWFSSTELGKRFARSIRDVMTWVNFINVCTDPSIGLSVGSAYIHGACLTFLDSLGAGVTSFEGDKSIRALRLSALNYLQAQVGRATGQNLANTQEYLGGDLSTEASRNEDSFGIQPFFIHCGTQPRPSRDDFLLSAPTTRMNAMRVLRGLQLGKALLLEGSPGVGKTSLVSALARAAGHKLTRINLSDQTDISDLFGADLPVEGGVGGQFSWRDGPFLQALAAGHWILLDELNLASQSVLEGLNAVLDHRGDLFIPELGRTFHIKAGQTRLFACQNPLSQGGARRGLPQSFLNRFTQVHVETLAQDDLQFICSTQFPSLPSDLVHRMITFNWRVAEETGPLGKWGQRGSPWEMNLRDLTRWCEATVAGSANGPLNPGRFVQLIYVDRMRTLDDKKQMMLVYEEVFGADYPICCEVPLIHITPDLAYVGDVTLSRSDNGASENSLLLLRRQLPLLQSLARCVSFNWMAIIVGPSGSGKTSLVHLLSQIVGCELRTLSVNSSMDTTEILGGFEQVDYNRHLDEISSQVERIVMSAVRHLLLLGSSVKSCEILSKWALFLHPSKKPKGDEVQTLKSEMDMFSTRLCSLQEVLKSIPQTALTVSQSKSHEILLSQLKTLKENTVRDNSLNAGGKFEWVDSILVKSLIEGCWLLVDNVNLCSAAVLDRLNGLLEPGGVLTIGERGVNAQGELITVKPHPNFRLFLTMDPRHGEISRAMRNRGVEIFVLDNAHDEVLNDLDNSTLLHAVGLQTRYEQLLLLHIHEVMTDFIKGPDRPSIAELLQAAFLVVQQVQRGIPWSSALLSACTKVYVQARISDSPDAKRHSLDILKDTVKMGLPKTPSISVEVLVALATLNTSDLLWNPALAMVKQRSTLLLSFANADDAADVLEVGSFLKVPDVKINILNLLNHLVLSFYLKSTPADLSLGYRWLTEVLADAKHGKYILALSDALQSRLANAVDLVDGHLTWDRRWLPDVSTAIAAQAGEYNQGVENRVALLLYFTAKVIHQNVSSSAQDKILKHKLISVLEYSKAVTKGTLADSLSSHPLLTSVAPLLSKITTAIDSVLNSPGVGITSDQWWSGRLALLWLERLQKQSATLLLSSDPNATDEAINVLSVHYRWIAKHTIPVVSELLQESMLEMDDLQKVVSSIEKGMKANSRVLWHVAKQVRRTIGEPLPQPSRRHALLTEEALRLCSLLSVWDSSTDGNSRSKIDSRLVHFLTTPEGKKSRIVASIGLCGVRRGVDNDTVSERLDLAHELSSMGGLTSTVLERDALLKDVNFEVLLWPVKEAVCLNVASGVLREMLCLAANNLESKQKSTCASPLTLQFVRLLRTVPSIPAAVLGTIDATCAVLNESFGEALLYAILWLHTLAENSLAVQDTQKWLLYGSNMVEDGQTQKKAPQHCPIISRSTSALILNQSPSSSDLLATSALSHHQRHLTLLVELRNLLWRNSAALSSSQLNYSKNEVKSVIAAGRHLLQALIQSCQIELETTTKQTLEEQAQTVICKLSSTFSEKSLALSNFTSLLLRMAKAVDAVNEVDSDNKRQLLRVGHAWALVACVSTQLYTALPHIDPMCKHSLKLQYLDEEISATKCELYAADMMGAVQGLTPSHPHLQTLRSYLTQMEEQKLLLSCRVAARPEPPLYSSLAKEILHYVNTLGSSGVILSLTERLSLFANGSSGSLESQQLLREANTWLQSHSRFRNMINKQFGVWYPDVVQPVLAASAQLSHGVQLMVGIDEKLFWHADSAVHSTDLSKLVLALARFPSLCATQPSVLTMTTTLTSQYTAQLLEHATIAVYETKDTDKAQVHSQQEIYWLLKSASLELRNVISISDSLTGPEWQALLTVLRQFVLMWEKQEQERKISKLQEESMYKSRGATRCETVSEEDEIKMGMADMFPSQREMDFGDLEPCNALEDGTRETSLQGSGNSQQMVGVLTNEDAAFFSSLHLQLVCAHTRSSWFDPTSKQAQTRDYLTPWLQRCAVASRLICTNAHILDNTLDQELVASWALAASLACRENKIVGNITSDNPNYDFYRSACIDEVKQCIPVLESVMCRVEQLLAEWPEHPTLNQILVVINRVRSFPVTSSVSRFLTGLEILLGKMREWEENAHSGVSMAVQSTAVTQLIIQWRRLELTCWKGSLNSAANRVRSEASRWWFHLFAMVESYICGPNSNEEAAMPTEELLTALERFMEEAPLGEFHARLDMLLGFHCHTQNIPSSPRQKEILSILWNLYGFYAQFSQAISDRIDELKKPIDKKLKDYVKIARWNDINYWAVKETVHKTQRTLHKHVKEFEATLKQPSRLTIQTSRLEGSKQSNKQSTTSRNGFVANLDLKQLAGNEPIAEVKDDSLVGRAATFFTRARKLTQRIVSSSEFPGLVGALNGFAGDVVDTVQHLASIEVDKTIPKPKQVAQAKNQLQMKRKALSDLFRTLQYIGLSYRAGLTHDDKDAVLKFSLLPPLEVRVALNSLSTKGTTFSSADQAIIGAWDGCESYFLRSIARSVSLNTALRKPHKDLGPPTLERLRGFSTDIMALSRSQHESVSESISLLIEVRILINQLTAIEGVAAHQIPRQSVLREWNDRLETLLVSTSLVVQQFRLLLDACPDSHLDGDSESVPVVTLGENTLPPMLGAVFSDSCWHETAEHVDKMIVTTTNLKEKLHSYCASPVDHATLITADHYNFMLSVIDSIRNIAVELSSMKLQFELPDQPNPLVQSITWLVEQIHSEANEFECACHSQPNLAEKESITMSGLISHIDNLIHNILLSIQNMYKAQGLDLHHETQADEHLQKNSKSLSAAGKEEKETETRNDSELHEKHLSEGLVKSLQEDLERLNLSNIRRLLHIVITELLAAFDAGGPSTVMTSFSKLALQCVPLLQQWVLLCQFIIQQQISTLRASSKLMSILLAVFGDLVAKGFCIPEELMSSEEAGDGEGQTQQQQEGAMGLGDGEGEKDVSERIETEDQLDDARPAGEEKKDEDVDCKEEEKGIEMSENFDSKLQDVDKKGDEDEEEEEEEDNGDAEKEMGDTEKDAEHLDEQVWGSDSEKDDESGDEGEGKEEERGNSKETGEKEMGPKENDGKKGEDEDERETGKDKETLKPEINEMQDPEPDDDQVDPYHGNQQPDVEPEPMDLPDDIRLDDEDGKENEETGEENPFDVDAMKEQMPPDPEEETCDLEKEKEKEEGNDGEDGISSDEDNGEADENGGEADDENSQDDDAAKMDESEDPEETGERNNMDKESIEDKEDESEKPGEENDKDECNPSHDDPTIEKAQAAKDENQGTKDQVACTPEDVQKTSGEQPPEEADGDPGADEREAVGQAPTSQEQKGHHGNRSGKRPQQNQRNQELEEEKKRQRPGKSDDNRTLGDVEEPVKKRLKTVDMKQLEENQDENEDTEQSEQAADAYQHIKNAGERSETQTLDAATKEQAEQQPVVSQEEEEDPAEPSEEQMDIDDEEIDMQANEKADKRKPDEITESKKDKEKKDKGGQNQPASDQPDQKHSIEVEGEQVETLKVARGPETTFHTRHEELSVPLVFDTVEVQQHTDAVRLELQNLLATWSQAPASEEAQQAWQTLSSVTSGLARDLSEQLRLVLEPTQASRLKGNFRTGRRINMRKVIPYIASQFRKDKIWMRRTKPSKREYQILLAIDDSSSMADNRSKELAFESLALVSQALTLLEVGELGVLSFGETTKMLHKLGEPFTQHSGARLMQQFSFEQCKTQVGALVDFTFGLLAESKMRTSAEHAQLLLVVSDGRGVFSEGQEKVCATVRRARLAGIFMVFIIIDNPGNKDSILDIRTPVFRGGKLVEISSYMDSFPFPFYLILRDIANLPAVLSDALRQWFELVTSAE